jgi:ADP-ribose pyrophosphatase
MGRSTAAMVEWPYPVGEPTVVGERVWGKGAINQKFFNPKTGETEEWLLFDYQKGGQPVLVSCVFPVTPDGAVVAVREYRRGPSRPMLQLPVGVGEKGKTTFKEIAHRELEEETGHQTNEMVHISQNPTWIDSIYTGSVEAFLAKNCEPTEEGQKLDPAEVMFVEPYSVADWVLMIQDGEVTDQMSITVTSLALPHLGIEMIISEWLQ